MSDRRGDTLLESRKWTVSDLMDDGKFGIVTNDSDAFIVIGCGERKTHEELQAIVDEHNEGR